jgi:hypothetical protein
VAYGYITLGHLLQPAFRATVKAGETQMQLAFRNAHIFRAVLLAGALSTYALAGPPLICHPFDISGSNSLPWGSGWDRADPSYDRTHVAADTLTLLTPQTPVLVRMETLRRAALYSTENPAQGYELLARLLARSTGGDKLALFDAGYLVETFKQAHMMHKPLLAVGIDGQAWVLEALHSGAGDTASMEFAASLIESGAQSGHWPNDHSRRAESGAAENSLLARNLKSFGK